jgi:hypothetical protein
MSKAETPSVTRPPATRSFRPGVTVGIVLVSVWMAASLAYSWLILGLGELYVCPGSDDPCSERYQFWWGTLFVVHLVVIFATILLWVVRQTRRWAWILGLVGTGPPAIAFTLAFDVPL